MQVALCTRLFLKFQVPLFTPSRPKLLKKRTMTPTVTAPVATPGRSSKPQKSDFRFLHRLRVRWSEVDMQKIVFNAHYLTYMDTAIGDYWRALALPYEEAMLALGGELFVKKASVDYHGSARCEDLLEIGLRCAHIGNSSIQFVGAVFRGGELLVACELLYVFADPVSKRPQTVPDSLRHLLQAYEAGEPVFSVRQGSWDELDCDALDVRTEVFVDERKIPLEVERDGQDEGAFHVVVFNGLGQSIATGRLLGANNGQARVGRLAVRRVLRGIGLGPRVLRALQAEAKRRGDTELVLNSQCANRGFYEALGFAGRGQIFDKGGVPTLEMGLAL